MPGFMPGIHALDASKTWMAGTSPAMTKKLQPKKFGAGDGIRTHDPDLGKVVLYP